MYRNYFWVRLRKELKNKVQNSWKVRFLQFSTFSAGNKNFGKEILVSSCKIEIPNANRCDPDSVAEKFCRISRMNISVSEDFTSGFETDTGTLSFELEAPGDLSWQGLKPVTLDYVVSNLPTSQCHVFTEPHILTFDQSRFDFYGTGTFLLARNDVDGFEVKKWAGWHSSRVA